MSQDLLKIYCTIKPELKRAKVIKGTFFAAFGIILLFSAFFLPEKFLTVWGIWVWMISLFFIAFGLVPYRKLLQLETKPDELVIVGDKENRLHFFSRRILRWSIPLDEIEKCVYCEENKNYGLGICLKNDSLILQCWASKQLCSKYGFDLYVPYFTKKASLLLNECLFNDILSDKKDNESENSHRDHFSKSH